MESNKQTDDLLNLIRKELTAIIDDKKPKEPEKPGDSSPTTTVVTRAVPIPNTSLNVAANTKPQATLMDVSVDNLLKRSLEVFPRVVKVPAAAPTSTCETPKQFKRSVEVLPRVVKVTAAAPISKCEIPKQSKRGAEKLVCSKAAEQKGLLQNLSTKSTDGQKQRRTSTTKNNVKNPLQHKKSTKSTETLTKRVGGGTTKITTPYDMKIENQLLFSDSSLTKQSSATDAFDASSGISSNAARSMDFMENQVGKNIDEDMQKMKLELKQSYELIQSVGEKFNAIDFSTLKSRIRDLHLHNVKSYAELQKDFEKSCVENRLQDLTRDAASTFRRHPGEFGDIPELSAFFTACTQLEHGLDKLSKQRKKKNELESRMNWASEIAYERMNEIRTAVGQNPEKNF